MSNAITLPSKLYFRRSEVRSIFGFSEESTTKLIRAGTLKPVLLPGDKRSYFARQDLVALLPNNQATLTPPAAHASASTKTVLTTEAQRRRVKP